MKTDDIERLIKLHQSVTDREIQKLLLRFLEIEAEKRAAYREPLAGISQYPIEQMQGQNQIGAMSGGIMPARQNL